jgi:hypothetical protein
VGQPLGHRIVATRSRTSCLARRVLNTNTLPRQRNSTDGHRKEQRKNRQTRRQFGSCHARLTSTSLPPAAH